MPKLKLSLVVLLIFMFNLKNANSAFQSLNRMPEFVNSGFEVLQEAGQIFNEELNRTKSENEAADIWIAYQVSLRRVIESAMQEIIPKLVESGGDMDISTECMQAMFRMTGALQQQADWAIKLLDSSGRPLSPGSLHGTITDLGDFDQCLDVKTKEGESEQESFVGQYCIVKYSLPLPRPKRKGLTLQSRVFNFTGTSIDGTFLEEFAEVAHAFYDRKARIGICIPSMCTQKDFELILNKFVSPRLNVTVNNCQVKDSISFNQVQVGILCVFALIALIMIVATSIDLILAYRRKEEQEAQKRLDQIDSKAKLIIGTLLSFSVYTNGKILFDTDSRSYSFIDCVNGIRVLSMVWILWTHTYLIPIKETFAFAKDFMYSVEEMPFQFILNGWVLVDSFFLVGAMLSTYSHLNQLKKTDGKINFLNLVFNRFFRLSPAVWLTVMLAFITPTIGSGPLWHEYLDYQTSKCYKYWWATILYINNWYHENKMCLLHTWYLSADFQLYLFAVALIIPLYKKPKLGFYILIGGTVASDLAIAIRTILMNQPPTVLYNTPSENDVYDQAEHIYSHTYIHLGPYCVGIYLGYILFQKKKYKFNPLILSGIWFLCFASLLTIILITHPMNAGDKWSPLSSALYAGTHRTAWSIAIGWVIFACATGIGGPINTFLSWSFFSPLGKLSYMIYLMHFLVIWTRYAYLRQRLPFSHYTMFCEFITNLVLSVCAALITYLAVEAPMLILYRLHLSKLFQFAIVRLKVPVKSPKTPQVITSRL